ncbi:MAG: branched-chain amino acid ABC transporter permease [Deltaproteobacteria bacterium]|nr:branched-chain amino acid ABC transporter permease [Deltaproteobacteria bacterium]
MNSKLTPYLVALGVMALLALFPLLVKVAAPDMWELTAHIGIKIMLNVGFGLCLWLMLQAGELSLGQGGFITIGAYTTGILVAKYKLISIVWLGYLAGAVAAAILALMLGYLIVHLKRIFFLLVTWSFAEMLHPVLTSFEHPFGGAMGIIDIPGPEGLSLFSETWTGYYYIALIYGFAVLWIVWRLAGSKIGLINKSIGQNDTLVTFCGLYVRKYKVMVFVLGCFITGIGGGILASYLSAISPETFTFFTSLDIIMFNLVGGMGTMSGPIVGAVILSGLNEYLFAVGYWRMVVYGLIIIFFITLLPGGMISLPAVVRARFNRKAEKQEARHG